MPDRAAALLGEIESWYEDGGAEPRCSFCGSGGFPCAAAFRGKTSFTAGRVNDPTFVVQIGPLAARVAEGIEDDEYFALDRVSAIPTARICESCARHAGPNPPRPPAAMIVADAARAIRAHDSGSEWAAAALETRIFASDCSLCDRRSEHLARGRGADLCADCAAAAARVLASYRAANLR